MRFFGVFMLFTSLFPSCAFLDKPKKEVIIAESSDALAQLVPSKSASGTVDYKFNQKTYKAGWITCSIENSRNSVVTMHRDDAGFDPSKFCSGWMAQVFLKEGYDVIAVNRPGFVNSTGPKDMSGPQSLTAIKAGVNAAVASNKKPAIGTWGYSTGAIAAAFYAKDAKELQWAIFGGGIYDLETQYKNKKNTLLTSMIDSAKKTEGDAVFEHRSISYDFVGLPKRLALYHGKNDLDVEVAQAISFRDSLRSQEFRVTLEELDNTGHDIPWPNHYQILQALARSVK